MNVRTRIVKLAAAVTLSATAVGIAGLAPAGAATQPDRSHVAVAGDPSQWGRSVAGDPSQWGFRGGFSAEKVNEYEGQHR